MGAHSSLRSLTPVAFHPPSLSRQDLHAFPSRRIMTLLPLTLGFILMEQQATENYFSQETDESKNCRRNSKLDSMSHAPQQPTQPLSFTVVTYTGGKLLHTLLIP